MPRSYPTHKEIEGFGIILIELCFFKEFREFSKSDFFEYMKNY